MRLILSILGFQLFSFFGFATECEYYSPKEFVKTAKYTFLGRVTQVEGDIVYLKVIENYGAHVEKLIILDFRRKAKIAGVEGSAAYSIGTDYLISTTQEKRQEKDKVIFKLGFCSVQKKASEIPEILAQLRGKK